MNRMKWIIAAVVVVLLVMTVPALAQTIQTQLVTPSFTLVDSDGNTVADIWEVDGEWFVSGSVDHFCPCGTATCDKEIIPPTNIPSDTPVVPTPTPVGPTPTPTDSPEPTPKPKCNRGIGNGSENCDPGNSGGQGRGDGRRAGEDRDE